MMMIGMMMIKITLLFFTLLSIFSAYSSYSGWGLEEVIQDSKYSTNIYHSSRTGSSHSYSNGGWSYGK